MTDPIRHVIVLMLENRSFDHFLGALPNVDGIDPGRPWTNRRAPRSRKTYAQQADAVRKMRPDPRHDTKHVLRQVKGDGLGRMGGFVYDFVVSEPNAEQAWGQVMSYFPLGSLPALHELATSFCACDAWFSSVPGPTWANRFFAHSGTSQGWVEMPQLPFHLNLHNYDQTTVFDRLGERGVRWRIYAGDIPQSLVLYNQRRPINLRGYRRLASFFNDVSQGDEPEFPAYTFIKPAYLPYGQSDQHPPHDVLKGDDLIASVYNALRANTELWDSSLLIVTWDEHGGFFDHVYPPPAVPPDHNVQEFTFDQYGVRVPTLLVSKWVRPGSCFRPSEGVLDHTSILRYLSDKFGLGPLGNRVAGAATFEGAIGNAPNEDTPKRVGASPRPVDLRVIGEAIPPRLNKNQAALVEFTKHLEVEMGVPVQELGLRELRGRASLQGEIEVARERVWRFIEQGAAS